VSAALPVCTGAEAVRAFKKIGWVVDRQKGSHIILKKAGAAVVLSIPQHNPLGKGLLRSLISDSGLTVDQFAKLL
jgi:predicted RNA binding protein YcfA (HicA-like mRNA interferase family)